MLGKRTQPAPAGCGETRAGLLGAAFKDLESAVKSLRFALYELTMLVATDLSLPIVFFDPNAYKAELQHIFLARTERHLDVPGDLRRAVFPRLGIDLGAVGLSRRGSSRPFAATGRVCLFVT